MNEFKDKFSYNFKTAISTGEGRNVTGNADAGVAITVELLPSGASGTEPILKEIL
jgi:hypothetical protein